MNYISVCSGIEAASMAWHPLGWNPLAFSEVDKAASRVLAHHYPSVPNLGDMTKFREWPDYAARLLVGGTPCQSFSVAGLRKGMADPRGNLALVYLAIADKFKPDWIVWENVPGVLSSNGGRDFGSFLGGLGQLGYGWAYRVLDAQYVRVDGFGRAVPQRRRRVFVVGCLGDWRRAAAVLFERESLCGNTPPRRQAGQGTAHDVAPSLTSSGRGVERGGDTRGQDPVIAEPVSKCLNAGAMGRIDSESESESFVAHSLRASGFDASEDGTGRGTPLVPVVLHVAETASTLNAHYGNKWGLEDQHINQGAPLFVAETLTSNGDAHSGYRDEKGLVPVAYGFQPRIARNGRGDTGDIAGALNAQSGETGRGDASPHVAITFQERGRDGGRSLEIGGEVAFALTSPNGGGRAQERMILTPQWAVRRLTPTECERLQGFPDGYTDVPPPGKASTPDGPRYKQLGNSMAVNVMRWIGTRIQMVEDALKAENEAA